MTTRARTSKSEIFGWIGVIMILSSYGLLSLGFIDGQSVIYHCLVLFGSVLVAIISYQKRTYQPMVLNITFSVLAIIALIRIAFW